MVEKNKEIPEEHWQALREAEIEFEKDPVLLDFDETMAEMRKMINRGSRKAV